MGGRSKLFTLFALHNWSSPAIQGLNFKYSEFKNHLKIHDDPALTSFFSKKCSESNRNPIIVDLAHMKDYITRCIYSCKVVAALLELHVYCRVSNPPDSFGRLQEREWQVEQGGVGRHLEVMERSSNRINVTNHVTSHNASGPRIGASSPKNGLRMKNFEVQYYDLPDTWHLDWHLLEQLHLWCFSIWGILASVCRKHSSMKIGIWNDTFTCLHYICGFYTQYLSLSLSLNVYVIHIFF